MAGKTRYAYTPAQEQALKVLLELGFCRVNATRLEKQIENVWLQIPVQQGGGKDLGLGTKAIGAYVMRHSKAMEDKDARMEHWEQWVQEHNKDVASPWAPAEKRGFAAEDRRILQNLNRLGLCRNTIRARIQVENVWMHVPIEERGGLGIKLDIAKIMSWVAQSNSPTQSKVEDKAGSMMRWERWVAGHNDGVPAYTYEDGSIARGTDKIAMGAIENLLKLGICRTTNKVKAQLQTVWLNVPLSENGGLGSGLTVPEILAYVKSNVVADKVASMRSWEEWVLEHSTTGANEHEDSDSPLTALSDLEVPSSPDTSRYTAERLEARPPIAEAPVMQEVNPAGENNGATKPPYSLRNRNKIASGEKSNYGYLPEDSGAEADEEYGLGSDQEENWDLDSPVPEPKADAQARQRELKGKAPARGQDSKGKGPAKKRESKPWTPPKPRRKPYLTSRAEWEALRAEEARRQGGTTVGNRVVEPSTPAQNQSRDDQLTDEQMNMVKAMLDKAGQSGDWLGAANAVIAERRLQGRQAERSSKRRSPHEEDVEEDSTHRAPLAKKARTTGTQPPANDVVERITDGEGDSEMTDAEEPATTSVAQSPAMATAPYSGPAQSGSEDSGAEILDPRRPWLLANGGTGDWFWYPPSAEVVPGVSGSGNWTGAPVPLQQLDRATTFELTITVNREAIGAVLQGLQNVDGIQQLRCLGWQA